jgi:hypothetical protein
MSRGLSRARSALLTTLFVGMLAAPAAAAASPGPAPVSSPFTFAVIGDIPYGDRQFRAFPGEIDQINADPAVRFVTHLGDIKDSSTRCDNSYLAAIRKDFDRFQDPLVYTVGDNEWTDCHSPSNGAYDPLERLAKIRQVFFDRPGHTLGQGSVRVDTQAGRGVPENVAYTRAGVDFAAMHIVGSNNDLAPWTGLGNTSPTPAQRAEERLRTRASIDLVIQTFARAEHYRNRAVVLMLQADMFDPAVRHPQFGDYSAFQPLVQTIAERSARFHGPVYLFNGDSHVYNQDHPLADGSTWLSFYGVTRTADNLTRVTVDGSSHAIDYLRVRVNPGDRDVLSWERIRYTS